MTVSFNPSEMFEGVLDEALLGLPSAEALGAEIPVRSSAAFISDDSRIVSGVWEAEPGLSRWEFLERGEVIHILEGRMLVTKDGHGGVMLTAGTAAVFPVGWRGTWEIQERIRKFFVVYRP